jgi:microcin C transport system permease protein
MGAYILRRLLLIIPTLLGIMILNFVIIQFAPGGPVEQILYQLEHSGDAGGATERISGGGDALQTTTDTTSNGQGRYRGSQGLEQELKDELTKQFGLDRPPLERFFLMLWNYVRLDFGESFYRSVSVIDLIVEKMPVSISLGLWTTLIAYLVSIPLGIAKAVSDGSRFDAISSGVIVAAYAIPSFLFAIMLLVLFAGGSYWQIFPLRGLTSENWADLSLIGKALDYLWHIVLPVSAMMVSGFATLTLLTRNSFLDEIRKQYVMTARAKGLSERGVLYGHVFRNAMLIVIAGFPGAFLSAFFTGALTLFIFGLMGLVVKLVSDMMYVWIDPRIDFERREG